MFSRVSPFNRGLHTHSMAVWLLYLLLQGEGTVFASPFTGVLIEKRKERPKAGKKSKTRIFHLIILSFLRSIKNNSCVIAGKASSGRVRFFEDQNT
jgi:hypothetical protein